VFRTHRCRAVDQRVQWHVVEHPLRQQHFDHRRHQQAVRRPGIAHPPPPRGGELRRRKHRGPNGKRGEHVSEAGDVVQWGPRRIPVVWSQPDHLGRHLDPRRQHVLGERDALRLTRRARGVKVEGDGPPGSRQQRNRAAQVRHDVDVGVGKPRRRGRRFVPTGFGDDHSTPEARHRACKFARRQSRAHRREGSVRSRPTEQQGQRIGVRRQQCRHRRPRPRFEAGQHFCGVPCLADELATGHGARFVDDRQPATGRVHCPHVVEPSHAEHRNASQLAAAEPVGYFSGRPVIARAMTSR
jgi:hypothetical protein